MREEVAIHDYENFPSSMYSEYMDVSDFDKIISAFKSEKDLDLPYEVVLEFKREMGVDSNEQVKEMFLTKTVSGSESDKELGEFYVELVGINGVQNKEFYFNYADYGFDVRMDLTEEEEEAYEDLDDAELGEQMIEKMYDGNIPKNLLEKHFDFESLGNELSINDYTCYSKDGYCYWFSNRYAKGGIASQGSNKIQLGDMVHVVAENRSGVVTNVISNGKHYSVKFVDGSKNIYDKNEIEKVRSEEDYDEYADGGDIDKGVDLFEDYENIPPKVQNILNKYSTGFEDGDYKILKTALKELENIGFTFEYGLDGVAYDLRPIGLKGKSEFDEYADGGEFGGGGSIGTTHYHKHNPNITFEILEYTNKGVKGLQKNPKSLSRKEKKEGIIVYYSTNEFRDLFEKEKYADGGEFGGGGKIPSVTQNDLKGKEFTFEGGKFLIVDFPNKQGAWNKGQRWRKTAKHETFVIKLNDVKTSLDKSLFFEFKKPNYVYDDFWLQFEGKPSRNISGNANKMKDNLLFEISERQGKMSDGGEFGGGGMTESEINKLYSKTKFINDDFNWKLKLLEMLQDQSVEAYHIYQNLTAKQKNEVLQEQFELDNDMGSDGDGEIETSKENLEILLADAKKGKLYKRGGMVSKNLKRVVSKGTKYGKLAVKKAKPKAKKIIRKAKIGFDALAKKVAKSYVGKAVAKKYQSVYGKRYSKAEAEEVGNKVAAKVKRMKGM